MRPATTEQRLAQERGEARRGWRRRSRGGARKERKNKKKSKNFVRFNLTNVVKGKRGPAVPVGAEQEGIFTHYISLYADWSQIRASDWIKQGREPQRRKKKVVYGFLIPYSVIVQIEK